MSKTKIVKAAAQITIRGVPNYSKAGKARVVKWLKQQVKFIEDHGEKLGPVFRARYLVPAKGK